MKMAEKIEELEKRIRELEARPVYVPIYVTPPQPYQPFPQPYLPVTYPWLPSQPWITSSLVKINPNTAGCAPAPMTHIYEFNA